jgi:hypothetical protein
MFSLHSTYFSPSAAELNNQSVPAPKSAGPPVKSKLEFLIRENSGMRQRCCRFFVSGRRRSIICHSPQQAEFATVGRLKNADPGPYCVYCQILQNQHLHRGSISVDSTGLTENLTCLESALTKNRGWGAQRQLVEPLYVLCGSISTDLRLAPSNKTSSALPKLRPLPTVRSQVLANRTRMCDSPAGTGTIISL